MCVCVCPACCTSIPTPPLEDYCCSKSLFVPAALECPSSSTSFGNSEPKVNGTSEQRNTARNILSPVRPITAAGSRWTPTRGLDVFHVSGLNLDGKTVDDLLIHQDHLSGNIESDNYRKEAKSPVGLRGNAASASRERWITAVWSQTSLLWWQI